MSDEPHPLVTEQDILNVRHQAAVMERAAAQIRLSIATDEREEHRQQRFQADRDRPEHGHQQTVFPPAKGRAIEIPDEYPREYIAFTVGTLRSQAPPSTVRLYLQDPSVGCFRVSIHHRDDHVRQRGEPVVCGPRQSLELLALRMYQECERCPARWSPLIAGTPQEHSPDCICTCSGTAVPHD